LAELSPNIDVDPREVDLGAVVTAVDHTFVVTVGNRGSGALSIADVSVDPDDAGFTVSAAPTQVVAGGAEEIALRFRIEAPGTAAADLVIRSNDEDEGTLRVPLQAEGGQARLFVSPNPVSFGRVNEGAGSAGTLSVANDGLDALAITDVAFVDDVGFVADRSGLADVLLPGEAGQVVISLAPNAAMVAAAGGAELVDRLRFQTSVGDEDVTVTANVNLAPVAVAVERDSRRSNIRVGVGDIVFVDGSDTTDPEGDAISYFWSVPTRPEGSITAVIGQGQALTRVTPDVIGAYVVRLRATDALGAFSEADLLMNPRDLALALRWAPAPDAPCRAFSAEQCAAFTESERRARCCGQSDLDLHLIAPGGVLGDTGSCPASCEDVAFCFEESDAHVDTCRQTGLDCSFANRRPEWGAIGRDDDPSLDIDDVAGAGPEIITLDNPADGSYRVVVHYCQDRIGEATDARLTVFDQGVVIFETPQQRIAEGQAWLSAVLVRENGGWQVISQPGVFEVDVPADLCTR
jgi:hypothetical protein